jgi:DNA-binding NarL/FixJ family response regulator
MLDGLAPRTMASAAKEVGVLVELGLVEQRYKAVLEVLDGGVSITETAQRYSICRQTVHT